MGMIEFRGVEMAYGSGAVLSGLDLTIEEGAVTAIIGPSGCGKSTILRLILGLITPTNGEVSFAGKPVAPENLEAVRRSIGYVIQDGGLFPHLTARQNVSLMARHLNREVDLDGLCALTRFPVDALDRFPNALSGGQRQRVGLMRALALDPKVLLLDEPLGALDPLVRAALQADLKQIFENEGSRRTVVLVTHDMGEAAYLASHIVLLRGGKLVQQGTLHEFQRNPAEEFVSEFLSAQRQLVAL